MGSGFGASGFAGGTGGGANAAVCCGFSSGFVSAGGVSVLAGLSAGGGSPFGLSTSLASGSPRSSDARRPRGGGGVGFGCGTGGAGVAFGGGSNTSWTGIGAVSAGGDIGQSIRTNNGSKCKMSEPTGPRSLLHQRDRSTCCSLSDGSGSRSTSFSSSRRRPGPIDPWAPACAGEAKKSAGSRSASAVRSTVMPSTGSRRSSSVVPNTCRRQPAASPARASQAASSRSVTPRAAAFVAFDPGSAPATT
jgi:hypothetical protein